jgi:hypothetical protein
MGNQRSQDDTDRIRLLIRSVGSCRLGEQFRDNSDNRLAGGKLFFYQAGTTILSNTYFEQTGTYPNTNPIILDANGRLGNPIYITSAADFKELLTDANGNVIAPWPMDNSGCWTDIGWRGLASHCGIGPRSDACSWRSAGSYGNE